MDEGSPRGARTPAPAIDTKASWTVDAGWGILLEVTVGIAGRRLNRRIRSGDLIQNPGGFAGTRYPLYIRFMRSFGNTAMREIGTAQHREP